jgi:hypothetical protein
MNEEQELELRKLREKEKQEREGCPFCHQNTAYGGSPEFWDQWRVRHEYHTARTPPNEKPYTTNGN